MAKLPGFWLCGIRLANADLISQHASWHVDLQANSSGGVLPPSPVTSVQGLPCRRNLVHIAVSGMERRDVE